MKTSIITFYRPLIAMHLLLLQPCQASSFFEMTLKHNSIYTPGKMHLAVELTDKAIIQGNYMFRVSIYVADTLMRKQTLPVAKGKQASFELFFPEVRSRTGVRCRAELFINGEFIEAKEKPLTLWPQLVSHPKKPAGKVIWIFDTSGKLEKIFEDMDIETIDATFQAARDFGTPTIVLIGQYIEPNSMQVITHRLASVDSKLVVIFLRQKRLMGNSEIEISREIDLSKSIVCDLNSPLLQGLTKLDIMEMVDNAIPVKITKQEDKRWFVNSYVTEVVKEEKNIYSYLSSIEENHQVTIYCQLPITDSDDPIHGILLDNMLKFAYKLNGLPKIQANRHGGRK